MTGTELVDLVIEHVGSQLTRAKAISAIQNEQVGLLGSRNLKLMRVLPDPFITTVAGTYQYAASSALFSSAGGVKGGTQYDIRTITRIYTFNNGMRLFAYNGEDQVSDRPYEDEDQGATSEVRAVMEVTPSLKANAADCQITWWQDQDPGNTTVDWRAECYRWPLAFTAETVDLEVPEGFQHTLLLWRVLAACGVKQYGTPGQSLQTLIEAEEKRFFNVLNGRPSSRKRRTPPRW